MADDDTVLAFPRPPGQAPVVVPGELALKASQPYRAYKLKLAGLSWAKVAISEGYPTAEAAELDVRLWQEAARALVADQDRQQMLSIHIARTEAIIGAHWPGMMAKNKHDADMVLSAMSMQAKTLRFEEAAVAESNENLNGNNVVIHPDSYTEDLERAINA